LEIITERKAETLWPDISIAGNPGGQPGLRRPAHSAIARAAVESVPRGSVAGVHPRDANVVGSACHQGRECVLCPIWRARNILFHGPGFACRSRGGKVNSCGSMVGHARIPQRVECSGFIGSQSDLRSEESPFAAIRRAIRRRTGYIHKSCDPIRAAVGRLAYVE